MARISTYAQDNTPKLSDKLIGSEVDNENQTKNYTIADILSLVPIPDTSPYIVVCTPSGGTVSTQPNDTVYLNWSGDSGVFSYKLPLASAIPYRQIMIVSDSIISASKSVNVITEVGDLIDGTTSYMLDTPYSGISIWSDGSQWIITQIKA
jgi:hypothetical protein